MHCSKCGKQISEITQTLDLCPTCQSKRLRTRGILAIILSSIYFIISYVPSGYIMYVDIMNGQVFGISVSRSVIYMIGYAISGLLMLIITILVFRFGIKSLKKAKKI
ncbi:MAG: hypothetical protein JXA54_06280 [Candidatus Heimdallarchaeota archaeon]|nr:hypothetical protein [Candidatus Heimdallarchaeota archaeon]